MFVQNFRHAVRLLRKNPGVTAIALLTLAIGIGASTAVFTVAYAVLLKPLPYDKPDEIVRLWELNASRHPINFADPNFEDLRSQASSLSGVAEYGADTASVSGGAEPVRVGLASVSRDFFSVMHVQPVVGRSFSPEEQHFGAAPVAVIGDSFWKQYFGGARDLSQLKIVVLNHPVSIIGVLPPGFAYPENSEIWIPRELLETLTSRTAHNWRVVGRLRPGVTLAQAHTELSTIAQRLRQQYRPDIDLTDFAVSRLQDSVSSTVRPALMVLLAAVGLLLLVACLNVANLLLAQTAARENELAIRVSMGAKRSQILRQFLLESLILSLCGGVLGLLAAQATLALLLRLAPPEIAVARISINLPVLCFALSIVLLIAVSLGSFSAFRASGSRLQSMLADGRRSQLGASSSQRLGGAIVAGQLALTLALLTGAGLLGRSLLSILSINPGFHTEHVLTMDLALSSFTTQEEESQRITFLDDLVSGLRAIPGVSDAGGTDCLPLVPGSGPDGAYLVLTPGQAIPKTVDDLVKLDYRSPNHGYASYVVASEGYFSSLGIPLLSGRLFEARDTIDAPHVALISESLAREKWLGQEALGRTIEFGNMDGDPRPFTVIGVVGDVRADSLETAPQPTVYAFYRQRPQAITATGHFVAVLRSSGDPAAVSTAARELVRRLDPNVPPDFGRFAAQVSDSLRARRFNLVLVGFFAASALLLAVVGLYGVMAQSVVRRTAEIGVRMALGATRSGIIRLVLGHAARFTAIGIAAGVLGSYFLARAIRSFLFGVSPVDPLTFLLVALLLVSVALVACLIPARRASRVDPMVALRYE